MRPHGVRIRSIDGLLRTADADTGIQRPIAGALRPDLAQYRAAAVAHAGVCKTQTQIIQHVRAAGGVIEPADLPHAVLALNFSRVVGTVRLAEHGPHVLTLHPQPQAADLRRQNARRYGILVLPAAVCRGFSAARRFFRTGDAVLRRFFIARRRFRCGRFGTGGLTGIVGVLVAQVPHGQRDGDSQHRAGGQRRDGQPARLPLDVRGLFDHAIAQVSDAAEQVFRRHTAIPSFKSASRSPARRRNSRDLTVFSVSPNRPDKRRTESP